MSISVTLENVSAGYGRIPAIRQVNGTFAAGSLTAIAGPNGAGKSTLLKVISGMLTPLEGRVLFSPANGKRAAYLPQAGLLPRDFPLTVRELIATGFWPKLGNFGRLTSAMRDGVAHALTAVGLQSFSERPIEHLSAGQFQRALFARLIVQDAPLILLDEPFSAVDDATCHALMEIISQWHQQGRTVICVSHDMHHIRHHFPHCLLLAHCCVAWGESAATLRPEHLEQAMPPHSARPPLTKGAAA